MNKKKSELDLSARVQEQVEDLVGWLGKDEAMVEIEAAISSVWHSEGARQYGFAGVPWVVQPGAHRFASEAAAIRWLREQGAQPVSLHMWAADGPGGDPSYWELEPAPGVVGEA